MSLKPKNPIPDPKNEKAFEIVRRVVEKFDFYTPFVIGITGAGGAGKTTFGTNIMKYYGTETCISIDLDDYLISREERGKLGLSGYNPRANKLFEARENIEGLISRQPISKSRYNHSTGEILADEIISPKEIIVIEGVTTLYTELRDLNQISFFLDALEETQIKSRVKRDVYERGYTLEEALQLYEALKPEYKRFIAPNKKFASIICGVSVDYVMHPIKIDKKFK